MSGTLLFGCIILCCIVFAMCVGGTMWLVDEIKDKIKNKKENKK